MRARVAGRMLGLALACAMAAAVVPVRAAAPAAGAKQSFLLVVSGIGGEGRYSERFEEWSRAMLDAAQSRLGMPRERIVYLSERGDFEDGRADGRSTKAGIAEAIARLAAVSREGDVVCLLLIGHGAARRDEALFNIPGPDVSAAELDEMLAALAGRRVVVVNGAPSSGPFIGELSGPDRIVITATASAAERYHTIFVEHFVAAFAGEGADTDKNDRVSMLEAFAYARRETQRTYEEERRLPTEHAMLDDDGDGVGSTGGEGTDGALARTVFLETEPAVAAASEALERLHAERARLEERIEALKTRKDEMGEAEYAGQLEALLVELALTNRAIRAAEEAAKEPAGDVL